MFCWENASNFTSNGVETSPSVGTTAKPSPIIFAEKTSSGTSEIGITFPFATEYNSVSFVETGAFLQQLIEKQVFL